MTMLLRGSISLALFFIFTFSSAQTVTELSWPREVDVDQGLVTLYQPQLESFEANILEGRSAISFKKKGEETLFGAFWFRAFLQTDLETRVAVLDQVDVLSIKFPGLEDSLQVESVKTKLASLLESMDIVMSLDRLIASLDDAGVEVNSSNNLNNNPPDIYYKNEPTVLITIDGDPIWKDMDQNGLKAVVNSPFFIVQDNKSKQYYINGGEYWYTSANATSSDWTSTEKVPSNVMKFAQDNAPEKEEQEEPEEKTQEEPVVPKILVVTKPSELIVTDGEPDYQPVNGTNLLYVANTESDIILDINAQQHYILLAGRWYKANKLTGDTWTFSEPESLPDEFSKIPADSNLASVRTNVPGTDESRDALLEQSIPQTAEVSRADTKIEVNFDGQPKFKQVPDTKVSYAENSDKQILKIGQKFYAVDNGIWFVSDYPEGPYSVSDERPKEVDDLPADSPVYNTKYVYVYDSTPTTVYVGYTPGYTHAYVYNGVVVYGTGYHYPYWYGSVYYPRPVTYGFNVHYNPYTGWGFSVGISTGGWIGWGYHPYYRPYWGPCGYRYGYRGGYGHGYHHGYRQGYNRGMANGYVNGYRAGQNNAYRNQRTGVTNTALKDRGNVDRSRISKGKNDLYTDKKGNVYQKDKGGNWQEKSNSRDKTAAGNRQNNATNKAGNKQTTDRTKSTANNPSRQPSTRDKATTPTKTPTQTKPTTGPVNTNRQPSTSNTYNRSNSNADLNRAAQNRQRGTQNYQRSNTQRTAPTRSTPGTRTMPSGGGGRRR
ncbi:hypothetical protein O3Q51_16750 [Cryomorphaceae bacterium 1068]|nr:hypothetical protein [Cryomorphaceae bacterium 1068]